MLFTQERGYEVEIAAAHAAYPVVPAILIRGVIAQESQYTAGAVRAEPNGNASIGLMQLLRTTAQGLGFSGDDVALQIPATNISLGTQYLAQLYGQLGAWDDVISAYNGGNRPALGFGGKATREMDVCLAHDAGGNCVRTHHTKVGEYSNQSYVDRVKAYMHYFTTGDVLAAIATPRGEALAVVLVALVALGVVGSAVARLGWLAIVAAVGLIAAGVFVFMGRPDVAAEGS